MRLVLLSVPLMLLAACGGPQTSQANNAQANMSNTASPPATATASVTADAFSPVSGDEAKSVMHERHEAMEGLGKAMKALHRQLESGKPDIDAVRQQTATMATTAPRIPGLFPAGTGPDAGKTRAKPQIWTEHDLFLRRAKDFEIAAQAIDAAARAGDLNKVMASHDGVDKACKACHDPFRAPEH